MAIPERLSLRRTYRPFWDPGNYIGFLVPMWLRATFLWTIASVIAVLILVNRSPGALLVPWQGEVAVWTFMYLVYRLTRSGLVTNEQGVKVRRFWRRTVRFRWGEIDRFTLRERWSTLPPQLVILLRDGKSIRTSITGSVPVDSRTMDGLTEELNEMLASTH